jgi:hypothetical protein
MHTYHTHYDVSVVSDYLEVPGLGFLPVNAFVVHGAQPVVVDTGLGLPDRDFVAALAEVIDPADVRWIWLTHPDRDHTGGLFALLDAAPKARVVTTFLGVGIMSCERPLPMDRVYLLNPGQSLDVGDRRLTGFRPPLFDASASARTVSALRWPRPNWPAHPTPPRLGQPSCAPGNCSGPRWTARGCTASTRPSTRRRSGYCAISARRPC